MNNAVIKRRTHREAVRFTLQWTIENFRSFQHETKTMDGAGITMAKLGLKDEYEGRWFISVIPCSVETVDNIEKRFVAVFLNISDMDTKSDVNSERDMEKESEKDMDNGSENDSDNGSEQESESEGRNQSTSTTREIVQELGQYDEASLCVSKQKIPVEFNGRLTTGKILQQEIWSDKESDVYTFSSDDNQMGWSDVISHHKLFGSDEKPGLLKDDCITISVNVVVYKQPQSNHIPKAIVSRTPSDYQYFATRQLNWYKSQQKQRSHDLDFTLQSSDGKEFHTSRWILMAHSAVFAAMWKQNSSGTKTSRFEMTDVDGETTEIMLDYLYGCCMKNINQGNVEKVLIMADKYQIMDLRHACEELLADSVTVDKAVHLLVVASGRGLEKLKTAALDAIPKNLTTILENEAVKKAMQADPYLMQSIMEHCSKRMRVVHET